MTEDSILFAVDPGGLIIQDTENRIHIGQSDTFMDSVCDIWCALAK